MQSESVVLHVGDGGQAGREERQRFWADPRRGVGRGPQRVQDQGQQI